MRTAYLCTWSLEEAEDHVQEALIRAARRWTSIKKMEFPYAYVRKILMNLLLRSAGRRTKSAAELKIGLSVLPADTEMDHELSMVDLRSDLKTALSTLPRRQRAVLVSRYFEGMTEAETAEQLGWPIGTVKSTTSRALEHLQRVLYRSTSEQTASPNT
jgi:RNA polymerase sigma factor (sigma-70 family)